MHINEWICNYISKKTEPFTLCQVVCSARRVCPELKYHEKRELIASILDELHTNGFLSYVYQRHYSVKYKPTVITPLAVNILWE